MSQRRPLLMHVITRLIVGGAQLTVIGLCKDLRDDFDVRVICGPDEGPEGSLRGEAEALVPLIVLPELHRQISPASDMRALRSLRHIFRITTPAIIHTHSSKAGILGRMAAPRSAARVHTVHGWGHTPADPTWKRELFVSLERIAARRTDALIAVSSDVRAEGCSLGIASFNAYEVIPEYVDYQPRSVDFSESRRRAREMLSIDADSEVLGWVGRFVPQKDPRTLVEALQTVLLTRPQVQAVLIGDGPERSETQRRIRDLGLASRVLFTGLRADARELIPAFDVLLHVSRWEGQPRVVQESIAERVPVVATRVSGLLDLVIPGQTGYLVEPGDACGLAERALAVLDGSGLRAPLPQSLIDELARCHGPEAVLKAHMHLYSQLLTASARR